MKTKKVIIVCLVLQCLAIILYLWNNKGVSERNLELDEFYTVSELLIRDFDQQDINKTIEYVSGEKFKERFKLLESAYMKIISDDSIDSTDKDDYQKIYEGVQFVQYACSNYNEISKMEKHNLQIQLMALEAFVGK